MQPGREVVVQPLFQRLLGDAFDELAPRVRALHTHPGTRRYRGGIEVERGRHPLARCAAWLTHLPPAGRAPLEVEIVADADGECWTRRVGSHAMRSRLRAHGGLLREYLGPVRFEFRLHAVDGGVAWTVVGVRAFGLPLPARWFRGVDARGGETDGRYTFDVRASLPFAGLLAHYRGWLDVDGGGRARSGN